MKVYKNKLTSVPPEIGDLTNLQSLDLSDNALASVPVEIGRLKSLETLKIDGNPITFPPAEIASQGTEAVLAYLSEIAEGSMPKWASKLLIVGEGGVGKTCMLRAILGEPFTAQDTTLGIDIRRIPIQHPAKPGTPLELNAWDFGGQEIYHATHQFFLTNRSLFILVWNSRHGFEQGKLYYWLDTIRARAPESPVILVATHIDQQAPDLPLSEILQKYPQVIGQIEISNTEGTGMEDLRSTIASAAAELPLMGELWPRTWLEAAEAIRTLDHKYVSSGDIWNIMDRNKVNAASRKVLAQWLHELGDILFFQDDGELRDLVILKPQWVTKYLYKVFNSERVRGNVGVFTREEMDSLWHDLESPMRDHFLRLMERFDLSYRTLEDREISLVVQCLPLDPPKYEIEWDTVRERASTCTEIKMIFRLDSVPAGIPTWFIARQHRFSTHMHWRNGVLFAYPSQTRTACAPDQKHLALIRAFPHERYLELHARGPMPQTFFALLRDGLETTLSRFPGLGVERRIPCPGHKGQPCRHEFDYETLVKRMGKKDTIECPESMEDVSVVELLFGLHPSTTDAVLSRIEESSSEQDKVLGLQNETIGKLNSLIELVQREFAIAFRLEQSKLESHCPNVFVLRPLEHHQWLQSLSGQKLELQLYCQAPGCWHPTAEGGKYEIDQPAEWLGAIAPFVKRLVDVLKFAAPLAGPWLGIMSPEVYEKVFRSDIAFMKELVAKLPEIRKSETAELVKVAGEAPTPKVSEGATLRAIRILLEKKDPAQNWGGLKNVLTPEGHYLWLCDYHAREYGS